MLQANSECKPSKLLLSGVFVLYLTSCCDNAGAISARVRMLQKVYMRLVQLWMSNCLNVHISWQAIKTVRTNQSLAKVHHSQRSGSKFMNPKVYAIV